MGNALGLPMYEWVHRYKDSEGLRRSINAARQTLKIERQHVQEVLDVMDDEDPHDQDDIADLQRQLGRVNSAFAILDELEVENPAYFREKSYREYISREDFERNCVEALKHGFRHATLEENHANAAAGPGTPELTLWREGFWVKDRADADWYALDAAEEQR